MALYLGFGFGDWGLDREFSCPEVPLYSKYVTSRVAILTPTPQKKGYTHIPT